jgi:SPP1 family predicted phage head-tail adaptor
MKEIEPVELDQQITIQQRASGVDARGQESGSWSALYTSIWASAHPLTGRELFAAGQVQTGITIRFRIRYRSDITARMRVLWRGAYYDIEGDPIDLEGKKQFLHLMCKAPGKDTR